MFVNLDSVMICIDIFELILLLVSLFWFNLFHFIVTPQTALMVI